MIISEKDGRLWHLTTVYASPNKQRRLILWELLDEMNASGPWILISDFNCTMKESERSSAGVFLQVSWARWKKMDAGSRLHRTEVHMAPWGQQCK